MSRPGRPYYDQRASYARGYSGRRRGGVLGTLFGFVFFLALLAFVAAVVLLVVRPTQPEILVQVTQWLDGLVSQLRR